MSPNQERIAQFRKMATDDPSNELAHYRLGGLLMEDGQHADAIKSFERTLELSPQFSRVYQLMAQCLQATGNTERAIEILRKGFEVADERGDNMPRDEMSRMLVSLGQPAPESKRASQAPTPGGTGGFRCQRPTCMAGAYAQQLPAPPFKDETGIKIHQTVCARCWEDWLRNYSIKVINELRLDLSTDHGQNEYDRYMREFLGLE